MSENNIVDWTVGVKFVQVRKNPSFSGGVNIMQPYLAAKPGLV